MTTEKLLESLPEQESVYRCSDCGINAEVAESPLYECGGCGTRFTRDNSADGGSHKCPDCNKFSAKVAELVCSECEENEVEEIMAYQCDACDDYHEEQEEWVQCQREHQSQELTAQPKVEKGEHA